MSRKHKSEVRSSRPIGGVKLKELAAHLGLSPTTLSLVLNGSPTAGSIPKETQDRIFSAARELNYRPNYLARSLRVQRTHTLGVIVPELSDGYSAMVLSGVETVLSAQGFFYLTASHRHRPNLLERLPLVLAERQVEGLIAVDAPIRQECRLPLINVSGRSDFKGVTNVILNHTKAAELGVGHLHGFGHRRIALIKGQEFSSDTEIRHLSILEAARRRGIPIDQKFVVQLCGDSPSPEVGYSAMKSLLVRKVKFTAVFAFNDVSAIGAIRALQEAGLSVPDDISVLGFDDIYAAAFHNPALTTVRQPLYEMGKSAAKALLERLGDPDFDVSPRVISVEPKLVVRNSTRKI